MTTFQWCKETYEGSISSRCWWFTPYDGGQWNDLICTDDELRQIIEMEAILDDVPQWARQIVERSINAACPCGHYLFPLPWLEVLDAIGSQTPPTFVHNCFTVEGGRKRQAQDYALCLDAWLAGSPSKAPARELSELGYRHIDWHAVCDDLWQVLGERTQVKELLVDRVLHSIRWAVKFTFWDRAATSLFGRDQYLGDFSRTDGQISIDGYYDRPTFHYEQASPRVQRLEARLAEVCPDWDVWRGQLGEWWLCAPKSFRFLERILWSVGREHPLRPTDRVPGFLHCEDTYPSQDDAAPWWTAFCAALDGWWRDQPTSDEVARDTEWRLGEPTPIKRWLVRLYLRKLRRLEENGVQLTQLVNARSGSSEHAHRRGAKPLQVTAL